MTFLLAVGLPDAGELVWMLVCTGTFALNHLYSFHRNVGEDLKGKPNIGTMMVLPYARVVPMRLCIILAAAKSNVLALTVFMLLKTGADVLTHLLEHRIYRKSGD